jgi:predicted  nucleic acid-binding Zn-ribbon protein
METIMNLPNNTPKIAIKWIGRLQQENDELKKEIEELKENQLTDESAIEHVYRCTDEYEDWIEGSDIYLDLEKEKDKYFKYLKDKDMECEDQRERAEIFVKKYTQLKEILDDIVPFISRFKRLSSNVHD